MLNKSDMKNINKENPVIAWWSGGVTSAVTCKLCVDWYGKDNVRVIFIDTFNEDESTYDFKQQCQVWYGMPIETIHSTEYSNIRDVWRKHLSLNVSTGAICSTVLKRLVREKWQKENKFSYQAFGFDIDEIKRAKGMKYNNPDVKPIFPLITELLTKKDCVKIIQKENSLFTPLELPLTYKLGYLNNNCWRTGCVQGGIGYWGKIKKEYTDKFEAMAEIEHELTDLKGSPVTILKDQSKGGGLVFLKPHPKYPNMKDISMMKGRPVVPLLECNGFCGADDIQPMKYQLELNRQD